MEEEKTRKGDEEKVIGLIVLDEERTIELGEERYEWRKKDGMQ